MSDEKKIKDLLKKQLDHKRMEHTEGVAYTAASLAMRYQADIKSAYLAGLLHDCAKCLDKKKQLSLCKKYNIELSEYEKENPSLIHAKLGSQLAREKYGIDEDEILSAIKCHTTGKPNMTMLEKIIFSADYIEPGRKTIPGLDEIRRIIFIDIDEAVYLILKNTIGYLEVGTKTIDETSRQALEFYEILHERKRKGEI